MVDPTAYTAATSDPDTRSYDAAMSDTPSHVIKWMEAAQKEISVEKTGKTRSDVDSSLAKTKIVVGTWVFKCKRTRTGQRNEKKIKARHLRVEK